MTVSADGFSAKIISAITVGLADMIRQLIISPATPTIADSMSAAVVPGAKLLACTMNGPAVPLMDIPASPPRMFACPVSCVIADEMRFSLACLAAADAGLVGGPRAKVLVVV